MHDNGQRNLEALGFTGQALQGHPGVQAGFASAPALGLGLPGLPAAPFPGLDAHSMMIMHQQAFLAGQPQPQGCLPQQHPRPQQQRHGPPPQPHPARGGPADLHRLKICGVPAGTFTDAKLRQLFELCGKVRGLDGRGGPRGLGQHGG
jgi:hypothetical protein